MSYKKRLKRNITLAYLTSFFTALIFIIPVWVAFERRFLTFTQMALLESFSLGITTFLELPTGALADLIGRRKTVLLGWLTSGIGYIYLAFASNVSMFFIGFGLFSVGAALISGADVALIYDSLKELDKEKYFSKYRSRAGMLYSAGMVVATFLGGYLYQFWVGLPYILMGASQLMATVFVSLMVEPRIDTERFTLKLYLEQTKSGFRELLKNRYMKKLTIYYMFVGGITWSCLYYFNQPFAKDLGFSEIGLSWLFGSVLLIGSLIIFGLAEKENLLTRNRVYLGFPIIISLSLLPGIFATKALAPLMLLGIDVAGGSRFVILDKYANLEFSSKFRATAVSALNMLVSLFYIIVVGLSGKVQDLYNTKLIFTILGILTLIFVFPSAISLVREHHRPKT